MTKIFSPVSTILLAVVTGGASPAVSQEQGKKTDVRALVSRPAETSRRAERRCKIDADCVPIMCRSYCGFDDVVNKKFAGVVQKRCDGARAERDMRRGSKLMVECAQRKSVEKISCKKRYCTMVDVFEHETPILQPDPSEEVDH